MGNEELFDFGIYAADSKEQDFYAYYDIAPIGLLSECQYDNEVRYGVSFGDDVCENIDENTETVSCDDCEKKTPKFPYYLPISDGIIVNLLLICGTEGLGLEFYYSKEHKQTVLDYVMNKSEDSEIKKLVRNFLIIYMQNYGRY